MIDLNPADLRLVSHATSDGVTTRELVLGEVTAALWAPEHAAPGTPLVLLGHGGAEATGTTPRCRAAPGLLTDVGFRAVAPLGQLISESAWRRSAGRGKGWKWR